jgi:hypothetical protein
LRLRAIPLPAAAQELGRSGAGLVALSPWRPLLVWGHEAPWAYDGTALPDRTYTAAEVDAALASLVEPGRLDHAQDVVIHAAPTLQRVLAEALAEGGWFGDLHDAEVSRAAAEQDDGERARAVGTLVAEQTRLGMFVGVAVGFELAHELAQLPTDQPSTEEH